MSSNITILQVFIDTRTGICSGAVKDAIESNATRSEYIDEVNEFKSITLGNEADYFTLHSLFVLPTPDSIAYTPVWDVVSGWYSIANEYFR